MKSSHVTVAGVVFAAVLIGCFALVGFKSDGEPSTPIPIPPADAPPTGAVTGPILPPPKPGSVAAGGFGEIARTERGYDGTAALARSSASAAAEIATWTIPSAEVGKFDLKYRDVRLNGEQLVTVSPTAIRVRDARTGNAEADGVTATADFPPTALSPDGDWAVQSAPDAVTIINTKSGLLTKIRPPAGGMAQFASAVGFDAGNRWCVVLGTEKGQFVLYRIGRNGTTAERVATLGSQAKGDEFRDIGRIDPLADGRFLFDRPTRAFRDRRFLVWSPDTDRAVTLPALGPGEHEIVKEFRVSTDGTQAVLFNERALAVVDLKTNLVRLTLKPDGYHIGDVAFAPSGERLLVAYTRWHSGLAHQDGLGKEPTEPGYAWVLDLKTQAQVGSKLSLGDLGIRDGFHAFPLSVDGSRAVILDARGEAHLLNTDRAFGPGVLTTGAPAAAPRGATTPAAPPDGGSDS